MRIDNYIKPNSIEEAYNLLTTTANSAVIGGGAFLRLSSKRVSLAIDLSNTGLNFIKETDNTIEIGAMTTFREIETSDILKKYSDGLISYSVKSILGVQMRNIITVGGTISGMYNFSDFITALLALDCWVVLHNEGEISLEEFINRKGCKKDIIKKIIIQKEDIHASFQSIRNTSTDIAILNAAVSKKDKEYKIVVGSRPGIASLSEEAVKFMNESENTMKNADEAGRIASENLDFGSNLRASAEYRKEICRVLVKRGIIEVQCKV